MFGNAVSTIFCTSVKSDDASTQDLAKFKILLKLKTCLIFCDSPAHLLNCVMIAPSGLTSAAKAGANFPANFSTSLTPSAIFFIPEIMDFIPLTICLIEKIITLIAATTIATQGTALLAAPAAEDIAPLNFPELPAIPPIVPAILVKEVPVSFTAFPFAIFSCLNFLASAEILLTSTCCSFISGWASLNAALILDASADNFLYSASSFTSSGCCALKLAIVSFVRALISFTCALIDFVYASNDLVSMFFMILCAVLSVSFNDLFNALTSASNFIVITPPSINYLLWIWIFI